MSILQWIVNVGAAFLIIGIAYSQFFKGKSKGEAEILSSSEETKKFWKDQAQDYKTMMEERERVNVARADALTKQINELTKEVGELKGRLISEQTMRERLEQIFQNRDPETQKFMELMIQSSKDQAEAHKEMIRVLGEIHSMATEEKQRDFHVTATVSKSDNNK